jgi:type VI secretion system protein ImpF
MPKGAERIVRRSVLDRLIQTGEPEPRSAAESVRALKQAVMRDVEWLLNTRRIAILAPPVLEEVNDSVYHYGLADITSVSADSPSIRLELLRRVEQCVERFEPRLTSIAVREAGAPGERTRNIRFQVEAVLRLDDPEPIYFETVLDPGSGHFNVSGSQ